MHLKIHLVTITFVINFHTNIFERKSTKKKCKTLKKDKLYTSTSMKDVFEKKKNYIHNRL